MRKIRIRTINHSNNFFSSRSGRSGQGGYDILCHLIYYFVNHSCLTLNGNEHVLELAGFIRTLVNEAWYALEGAAELDGPPAFSRSGPLIRSLPYNMPRSIPHEEERFAHKVSSNFF